LRNLSACGDRRWQRKYRHGDAFRNLSVKFLFFVQEFFANHGDTESRSFFQGFFSVSLCLRGSNPFWFRLVRVRVYGNLRNKAKALVGELKQKGIKQAHLEGNDEVTDILRLTCIEAGIRMNDKPDGVTWMVEGRNYRLISTVNEPAD